MNQQEKAELKAEIIEEIADVIGKTKIEYNYVYRDGDVGGEPDLRRTLDRIREQLIFRALKIEREGTNNERDRTHHT